MAVVYTVDTSVVVFMNREMPRDVHVSLWAAIEKLIVEGRMFMAREAYEELLGVGDACAPWAKSFENFICDATDDEVGIVLQISADHPNWVSEGRNAADPWIIANGSAHSRTVVTQERRKGPGTVDENLKIPNVCESWSVPCVNLNGLARDEGWSF